MTTDGIAVGPVQMKSLRGERQLAAQQGSTRYFTGIPCKHGHIAERLTVNGACCECCTIKDHARRAKEPKLRHAISYDTLTQQLLHELFDYSGGKLFWKVRPASCIQIGDEVGSTNDSKYGYLRVRLRDRRYMVHSLIFMYHHGYMPNLVDHIDGNSENNKIENLREATHSQNGLNKKVRSDSSTGVKNVTFHKPNSKWAVGLSVNGKRKHIGYFDDLELAELVAIEAREKFHGAFSSYSSRGI